MSPIPHAIPRKGKDSQGSKHPSQEDGSHLTYWGFISSSEKENIKIDHLEKFIHISHTVVLCLFVTQMLPQKKQYTHTSQFQETPRQQSPGSMMKSPSPRWGDATRGSPTHAPHPRTGSHGQQPQPRARQGPTRKYQVREMMPWVFLWGQECDQVSPHDSLLGLKPHASTWGPGSRLDESHD